MDSVLISPHARQRMDLRGASEQADSFIVVTVYVFYFGGKE